MLRAPTGSGKTETAIALPTPTFQPQNPILWPLHFKSGVVPMNLVIPDDILTEAQNDRSRTKAGNRHHPLQTGENQCWHLLCSWNWTWLSFAPELGKRGLSVKYDVEDFQTVLETSFFLSQLWWSSAIPSAIANLVGIWHAEKVVIALQQQEIGSTW